MLAEITNTWDITGIFCLASILWIIIIIIMYQGGFIAGSFGSCLALLIVLGVTGNNGEGFDPGYITNKNQTKWLKMDQADRWEEGSLYHTVNSWTDTYTDDYDIWIPADELFIDEKGSYRMKSTGDDPFNDRDENFYIWEAVTRSNTPVDEGGWGVPQWLYHPASARWLFALAAAPGILAGGFAVSKLKG